MKSSTRTLLILLLITSVCLPAAFAETVMVPMRDGTLLATDVNLPSKGGPAFPVLLTRTVYGRVGDPQMTALFTSMGVAFVSQDTRGRGDSEGKDMVFADDGWGERQDGADTVAWVKAQPWCNGKIGTWGYSALGIVQSLMAPVTSDVDFQLIGIGASSLYGQLVYQGGVLRKELVEPWLATQGSLHVLDIWKSHPAYDEFWTCYNTEERASHITAPGAHGGGWFDTFLQGTLNSFTTRQHEGGQGARGQQKLLIGPWGHGEMTPATGELTFSNSMSFNIIPFQVRLFQRWLLGQENGIMKEPAVNYYTMGDCDDPDAPGNEWRTADDWPPFPTVETAYYLQNDGVLALEPPVVEGAQKSFNFDPTDPCPTHGGANLNLPFGPMDQRKVSTRPDVLRFETAALDSPLEATGRVKVKVYVSSDAPDTDFTAKLVDIYPDGREMLILDSVQRVKFRNGFEKADPLPAGQIGEIVIDLWSTSMVFNEGHKIGVQISSCNYPRFEVNPNTGEDFPRYHDATADGNSLIDESSVRVAHNTVHMDRHRPSALYLSVRIGTNSELPDNATASSPAITP